MILLFINNYRKKIAFVFLLLLSLDITVPAMAIDTDIIYRYDTIHRKVTGDISFLHTYSGKKPLHKASDLPVIKATGRNNDFAVRVNDEGKMPLDIDGPGQPEMKSFQSVNSDNMVDLFTGDFSYNIPLLDVGGYPVNLHYNSGITMDQEASWVGLGWNINPGSISRNMRGLPDDFDGVNDSLTKTQHIKPDKTTGVTVAPSLEIVGQPQDISRVDLSAKLGIFYNTYNGYGLETGVGIGGTGKTAFGSLTGNLSISNNSQTGIAINPSVSAAFGKTEGENNMQGTLGISTGYSSRTGISSLQIDGGVKSDNDKVKKLARDMQGSTGASYPVATINFAKRAYTPSINMPLKNSAYSFTGKVGFVVAAHDASIAVTGYVNQQTIADEDVTQKISAAGYLYATNANGRENVLLDYNREKEVNYVYKTTPQIAIPQYTYDAFSISGEGTGGSFRAYRGDIGYVFDHNIASRNKSTNGSIDVGVGSGVHVGLEITHISTNSTNHRWDQKNNIESKLAFQKADTTYEPVYFRNPGEKTNNSQAYYRAIGDDSLIRVKLSGNKDHVFAESAFIKYNDEGRKDGEIPVTEALVKKERDKRTQVISYLTAEDASILGLDKMIRSYSKNDTFPGQNCVNVVTETPRVDGIRKKNHLSEISVLNSDGRKYVYGLPIYNAVQKDVSFAVAATSADSTGLVNYTADTDNSVLNTQGKDGYFSKEEIPGYAHNFLLTGIVSPDYVDITGNGVSEDDPGDAVRFNYTEVYGDKGDYFRWRLPFKKDSANFNEGLKTYSRDNKASYQYGEKEMWYLHTIESKTMVAVFVIRQDRKDAYGVVNENGEVDASQSAYRLDHIDLFVKADIVKNGSAAKPVKSVHFSYNYELCKGAQGDAAVGKLTLKSVWFTYNKNNKGKLNPYLFQYNPGSSGAPKADYNPAFNSRSSDRWGTYKSKSDNPAGMTNVDFPYSIQDSSKAARNASMWNLTDIQLPSGARMQVTYESDDYGYVQNKRAAQMVTISGIEQPSHNELYNDGTEFYKIYINTTETLKNREDLRSKYLDIDDVVYFKLAVNIPKTTAGNTIEMVPGYGTIEDYGINPSDNKQFWIKLAPVENSSPLTRAALQFLRLNLPFKAYPNSEGIDDINLENLVKMLATSFSEIKNVVLGFNESAKSRKWCKTIDLNRSFVRLSNPDRKKYGGGYRVKQIKIADNWNKMTSQKESVYGQEYIYTTTEDVNGVQKTISSGVAAYEPAIGGEENLFRRPISYIEKLAPMAPVNFMFSEEPLGESFFPAPIVGYSKVRVRTINAKAKSANGWAETEFYTSRDFPVKAEHTLLEEGDSKFKYETTSNIFRLNHKNYVTLSQGFKIELNDMNGKVKTQSSYAEADSLHPVSYSFNFYKVDDDNTLPAHLNNEVWAIDSTTGIINTSAQIGKDIEVMTDLREQESKAYTVGFSPNVDIVAPFIILPSKVNLPQKEEVRYRSAAVVKIVQRYGILDSVVVMDKGSVVSTKNMVYDAGTGNVVLSRTNNEFNDPVYNFNYPAYWAYSGMGQAYKNTGAVFQPNQVNGNLQLNEGKLYQANAVPYPAERFFESGDEVYVYKATLASAGADCRLLTIPGETWHGKLWAINAQKGVAKDTGFYFIDSLGRVAKNMIIEKMVITRSGKRNMTDVSAGNVVMLKSPVKQLPDGRYRILIDSSSHVLNASAASFSDLWKVENSEYQEDSCYVIYKEYTDSVFRPKGPATVFREAYQDYKGDDNDVLYQLGNIKSNLFAATAYKLNYRGNRYTQYKAKSILEFDLSKISPDATITSATLNLTATAPRTLWQGISNNNLTNFQFRTKAHFQNGDLTGPKTNETIISRAGTWSINSITTDVVPVGSAISLGTQPDYSCDDNSVSVTSIVSQMVANPLSNHGFLLNLKDWGNPDEPNSSDRTQSYCAEPVPGSDSGGGGESNRSLDEDCLDCIPATLSIDFSVYKDTCVKVCRKNISDTATNPYRWGILGNWRMDRSFVYYNAWQENDATVKKTNIRTEGILKDFVPYWSFASEKLQPGKDTTRWVWNSAIETFNRKGYEIENYDALGRYNAGLYGYNQTLPVAVAQNSRYRELLYDGFEDYGYTTNYCATCPPVREFDFVTGNSGVSLNDSLSHSGLYSVKINSGSESLLTVPVDSLPPAVVDSITAHIADSINFARSERLYTNIDSSLIYVSPVVGVGEGLNGTVTFRKKLSFTNICLTSDGATHDMTDGAINYDWTNSTPATLGSSDCAEGYRVSWTGTIQPRFTDKYTFYLRANGSASIVIQDTTVLNTTSQTGERSSTRTVTLQAGQLYSIAVTYNKLSASIPGPVQLSWSSLAGQLKEIVPVKLLYPVAPASADTTGSVTEAIKYYCVKADTVKPFNVVRGSFSPLNRSKLTVSAWVRLDVEDCNTTPALDSAIKINFNTGGDAAAVWLKKTGLRIEGWQRYEANVTVPADAASMYLRLKTASDYGIYVDDIRVQPFNSSMKSFVYDPVSLRLMAELDENNYASFYEYDNDGTLIRVKKETERGIMTIQETRSALFKE